MITAGAFDFKLYPFLKLDQVASVQ